MPVALLEYSCFLPTIAKTTAKMAIFLPTMQFVCYLLRVSGPTLPWLCSHRAMSMQLVDDSEVSLRSFLAQDRHRIEWPLFSSHILEEAIYFPTYFPYSASVHQDGRSTWQFRKRRYEQREFFSALKWLATC